MIKNPKIGLLFTPAVLLACAAHKGQTPATNAPVAEATAAPASHAIEPFMGPLVSADVATFQASCAHYLDHAQQQIARLKATKGKATDPYAVIALYDEYNAAANQAAGAADVVRNANANTA